MTTIKRHKVLYDATAAATGDWFRLDIRYDDTPLRTIQVELTASDTIVLEGTTKDVRGSTPALVIASLNANDISTITTLSTDAPYLLEGPWTYIRARKTGTAANAKVQGWI